MNAELTELVFILDRSGSMGGLESDTIGGFNGMIERQKKEGEKVNVTTILFDDEVEIIHDRFPIDAVQPLSYWQVRVSSAPCRQPSSQRTLLHLLYPCFVYLFHQHACLNLLGLRLDTH